MKHVTMRDIGATLGVSTVTISKALSGKEGVSDAVREKIVETARRMGYRYGAPEPETGSRIVGILIADRYFSAPSFYSSMYRELLKEISESGMLGVLEIVSDQDEQSQMPPVSMTIQKVSGIILVGQFSDDYVSAVLNTGLPTVLMDFAVDGVDVDAVLSDGIGGSAQTTRYLIEQGHREIGFLGTITRTTSVTERFTGFMRAMLSSDLEVHKEWLIPDAGEDGRYLEAFALPDRLPTAFVCNNDMVACALAAQLESRGLRVPEDVSIVGFDNYVYGPLSRPLSTYAVDQQRMAQETVRRLKTRIKEGMEGPVRVLVSGWFVERDSVVNRETGLRCGKMEAGK